MRSPTEIAVLLLAVATASGVAGCRRNVINDDTKARRELERIAEQSIAYAQGQRATPRLPVSSEWTPAGDPCQQPGRRFANEREVWARPPWSDIGYRLDVPSAYRFRIVRTGSGPSERLLVAAEGDPDCHGTPHRLALAVDAELHVQPIDVP